MSSAKITVGKIEGGGKLQLDVARLVASRLLIFAASGGGKSWLLRVILEELSGVMQTIVIDTESEFASLRELRDMVLVGPGGEIPADPRSAPLLCRRLMELNLSAVVDVGELSHSDRREFVRGFANTMVDLPRSLWRRCVVAVDEIQEYAPEGTKVESATALSRLANKGRKRGYCLLGATQRLKMLDKDVAAALKNVFIGQATLDIDLQRAAGTLGFDKKRWSEIRDLSPPGREGEFFAFGPALSVRGVVKFRAGKVRTTHPEPGQSRPAEPPAPSKRIKRVLAELQDLPQAAESEIRDLAKLRDQLAQVTRERDQANARATAASTSSANAAELARYRTAIEGALTIMRKIADAKPAAVVDVDPADIRAVLDDAAAKLTQIYQRSAAAGLRDAEHLRREVAGAVDRLSKFVNGHAATPAVKGPERHTPPPPPPAAARRKADAGENAGGKRLKSGARRMLQLVAAMSPRVLTERQLGTLSSYVGGTFREYIGSLSNSGLVVRTKAGVEITPDGVEFLGGDVPPMPDKRDVVDLFKKGLKSGAGAMLDWIVDRGRHPFTKDELASATGYTGGTFREYFGAIKNNGLIEVVDEGADTWRLADAFELLAGRPS